MSALRTYQNLGRLVTDLRDDLNNPTKPTQLVLLYAYNRTGKTRLSMQFKEAGKRKTKKNPEGKSDTLYFNAYTEDLFTWENDLDNDTTRRLWINSDSHFFDGFRELDLNKDIEKYLTRYVDFKFDIDYENWTISFSRDVLLLQRGEKKLTRVQDIKISRGEENIFIWCLFMAICERLVDNDVSYAWVKYLYIDDPISSLDDNNAIAVACDLADLLRRAANRTDEHREPSPIKVIFSSHHALFFNVMCNEMKKSDPKRYFLHRPNNDGEYTLRATDDTPFFHHVATLAELQRAADPDSGVLYTFHFNALRSIMEKTSSFFGHSDISFCLKALDAPDNEALFRRALHLLSHGKYTIHEPTVMGEDNQELFRQILNSFITRFQFDLPKILGGTTTTATS